VVDPAALGSIDRHLFAIRREKILSKQLTQLDKERSEAASDRKVRAYCVCGLTDIRDKKYRDPKRSEPDAECIRW
jgi:hypothetical protein